MTVIKLRRRIADSRAELAALEAYQDRELPRLIQRIAILEAQADHNARLVPLYTDRRAVRAQRRQESYELQADLLQQQADELLQQATERAARIDELHTAIEQMREQLLTELREYEHTGTPLPRDPDPYRLDVRRAVILDRYTLGSGGHVLTQHGQPMRGKQAMVQGVRIPLHVIKDVLAGRI